MVSPASVFPSPRLLPGGVHRDDRGVVRHVNAFDFGRVDRFYAVEPSRAGEVRGWVGHRREWKYFFASLGRLVVGVVQPANWEAPARKEKVVSFLLDQDAPAILEVPPGCFTASLALTPQSQLLIFSSGRIEDAAQDDYRLPAAHWPLAPKA